MAGNFAVKAPLTPKTVPFFDEFRKRTNRSPVYTAFGGNDSVYIYAEAVKRAGSTDTDKVIKELEKDELCRHPRHDRVRRDARREARHGQLQRTESVVCAMA